MRSVAVVTLLAMVSAGCTTITGSKGRPAGIPAGAVYDTQAILSTCPSDANAQSIPAAIASAVVAKGVSRIGAAIKAAGEAETRQVVVSRNIELSSEGMPPCLVVARGWFHSKRPAAGAGYVGSDGTAFDHDADPSFIRGQGLWLAATPDFFFEGRFKASLNKAALTLQPVYVYRGEPIATHTLRRGTARGTVLSFAISKPSKAKDLGKGQGATVVLGTLETNTERTFETSDKALFTCDGGPCEGDDFKLRLRGIAESDWFAIPLPDAPEPMTLQVLVSETRGASAFLKFVGEVFSDVEDELTTALQRELIPTVGDAADEADQTAEENALSAYEKALAEAYSKLAACAEAGTDAARAAAAKAAMRTANQKARAINRDAPFEPGTIDRIVVGAGTDAADACTAAGG